MEATDLLEGDLAMEELENHLEVTEEPMAADLNLATDHQVLLVI